jgi:CheY-like chemotaxis protein
MSREVLLIEDSPGDVRLTQEAFRASNADLQLHVAVDGNEALAFLKQQGSFAGAPRPDLILLDLNLPNINGSEVLARIKQDDNLKTIPTMVLATSQSEADVMRSLQLQANCYLAKPAQLDELERMVRSIDDFWLTKARFPPPC